MSGGLRIIFVVVLVVVVSSVIRNKIKESRSSAHDLMGDYRDQFAQVRPQTRPQIRRSVTPQRQEIYSVPASPRYAPISNLRTLRNRGCEDHDLSSLILQNELIKKDPQLAYNQLDIDDCNGLIQSYVERGVRENSSYLLRRKLVESFGQTNRAVLVNRMRLVAVFLGGEKGRGGIDPVFTPIREETHRFSPYVTVLIENYLKKLEEKMTQTGSNRGVSRQFKAFIDTLGDSFQSEYRIAEIGADSRGDPAKELYAMQVLLRDVRDYYGERVEAPADRPPYHVIFSDNGSFRSETLEILRGRHRSMSPGELSRSFIAVGLELREYLSALREKRGTSGRGGTEEVNHLKKLNEIAATLSGLFASERLKMDVVSQAETLVDLLFLEGLYSKKDRKELKKELGEDLEFGIGREEQTRAFDRYLNYMSGLAHAKLDEALGEAARAYARITSEAENYMEVQARKSSLQILGQLQVEFFEKHRGILAGRKDIHLAGTARGRLQVFRTESEIAQYLRRDPLNGAETIWVLKGGLTMPNAASFAAIILEDPIMKASHYDGYARSRNPPIPLLQVPGAVQAYSRFDGKNVVLEASRIPQEKVVIREATIAESQRKAAAAEKVRLEVESGTPQLYEIDAARNNEEIRQLRKQVGAKAANYAFLRSALPLGEARHEEHIYPGLAIPFHFYQQHVIASGAARVIASLDALEDAESVRRALLAIRNRILQAPVEGTLLELFERQMEDGLRGQHRIEETAVKLRFRSSSNAEDGKEFSGAGLYESHPAYYVYQTNGSSGRRARAENLRAVGEAIKMVWASLWKAEAYQARKQAGIAQDTVRMGILVHPSYRKEESTGVVFYYASDDIEIVANKGNENVQNPSIAGLTPEMHRVTKNGERQMTPTSRYSLSEKEVLSSKDRKQLMKLLKGVIPKFRDVYPEQGIAGVDVEFKVLEVPDGEGDEKDVVMLKQIRPLAKRVGMK